MPKCVSSISVGKALFVGHLIITIPVIVIVLGIFVAGITIFSSNASWLFLIIGFVLGWLWWSFTVPRWRRWALRNGASATKLQKWVVATGLTWPKGWVFEKTEFKVGEKD